MLVTHGWYGRTRHPLLLGVVAILFGEAAFFSSLALLGYALAYWLWLTAFVALKGGAGPAPHLRFELRRVLPGGATLDPEALTSRRPG